MKNTLKSITIKPKKDNLEPLVLNFDTPIDNIINHITKVTNIVPDNDRVYFLKNYGIELKISKGNNKYLVTQYCDVIQLDIEDEVFSEVIINYTFNNEDISMNFTNFLHLCKMASEVFKKFYYETIYTLNTFENTVMCRICVPDREILKSNDFLTAIIIGLAKEKD